MSQQNMQGDNPFQQVAANVASSKSFNTRMMLEAFQAAEGLSQKNNVFVERIRISQEIASVRGDLKNIFSDANPSVQIDKTKESIQKIIEDLSMIKPAAQLMNDIVKEFNPLHEKVTEAKIEREKLDHEIEKMKTELFDLTKQLKETKIDSKEASQRLEEISKKQDAIASGYSKLTEKENRCAADLEKLHTGTMQKIRATSNTIPEILARLQLR